MGQEILIVDDTDALREALGHQLETEGYAVTEFADGQEAKEAIESGLNPDLIVLDVMMPRLDGKRLLRLVRNGGLPVDSATPIIMLTSRSREEDVVAAFESGADDYVSKPFSTPELLARIERHLARSPVA